MKTHLLVAAEPLEFRGLEDRLGPWQRLSWPVDFARQTANRGERWIAAANGAGPVLASRVVAVATQRTRVDTVISTGFCGALDEPLEPASIFVARRILDQDPATVFETCLPRTSRTYACGSIISIDRFVSSAGEKRKLVATGAGAVEMEAAGVAFEAARRGLPFYCIRAVTDTAGESFRLDFDSVRNRSGRFSRWRLMGQAVRHPFHSVPELVWLYRRCRAASVALGEFLADCEF